MYKPFSDPGNYFAEDPKDLAEGEVRNRFLNPFFAYVLYMSTVGDNHSCLSWMFPASRKTEDIDRLLRRTIPACDPNAPGKMISFLGPEIPALFATAVECAAFRSFNAKDAPPIEIGRAHV